MTRTYEIVITADENDADYRTSIHDITDEDLVILQPMFDALKKNNKRYFTFERVREDRGQLGPDEMYADVPEEAREFFAELAPYSDYGLHTIDSIVIYEKPSKITIL